MPDPRRPRWLVALTEISDVTAYTGGIGRSYAALLPALVAVGVDVDVVLLGRDAPASRPVEGLPYHVIENARASAVPLAGPLLRALRTRRAVRRGRYDAVLLPEWEGLGALLPRSTPLITNLSTSLELITDIASSRPSVRSPRAWASYRLQVLLESRQIRRSRGVIGISRAIVDWNREHIAGTPRDVVVRNTVDLDRVQRGAARGGRPDAWPAGARTIAFLGRLEERKGIRVALAAFDRLARDHTDVHLVLIGGLGDPAKELTREGVLAAVSAEARDRVHLLGHLADESLYSAVGAADVVMTPSLWEGFGNVALEVKAIGVPLVATSGSGFGEFNTDGVDALLVPPGDVLALAEALARVLDDPALAAGMVARAREAIRAFAPEAVAADVVAAVDALLEERAG
ncbi:glycosyltransferase family 4 protein [Amnibacterium kyonggiense]